MGVVTAVTTCSCCPHPVQFSAEHIFPTGYIVCPRSLAPSDLVGHGFKRSRRWHVQVKHRTIVGSKPCHPPGSKPSPSKWTVRLRRSLVHRHAGIDSPGESCVKSRRHQQMIIQGEQTYGGQEREYTTNASSYVHLPGRPCVLISNIPTVLEIRQSQPMAGSS
ncbi:hypothetical protein BX600DRAFT_117862 [Xylariales sp. PMI_506]|nr:hypothetical protein BX600DRAFT_117862 [Xylariales sp. PMI_506]